MHSSPASTGLGLLSAASWGGSDFAGGLGARRAPALLVTFSGQLVSLAMLLGICFALRLGLPGRQELAYALIAGFEGALALAVFYRALAMGAMGLTAALTGLLTALVPVLFSAWHEGLPTPLAALGLAAGCAAIWLITHQPATDGARTPTRALLLGAGAGAGFGVQLVLFKLAAPAGVLAVMTAARAAGVAALLLVMLFARLNPAGRGFWLTGIAAGLLDTAGNLFYLAAARAGRLDVAAVVCSLYPAGTILLAGLVLREHPTRRQWAGMALALGAVALLSL
ncbi:MAG: EamA family transporter [Acidobacteriota bacterium]